ncbi:MAG: exopolysaccharide biosynthesis protein [Verrucomicrobia bacterium]|nr:exopolysaccharide biosynthesis protein [Verrucomicrobiota bacterium]
MKFSQKIEWVAHECEGRRSMTVGELAASLSARGQAFIALLLSLPFVSLLSLPGLSIILGGCIAFIGFRIFCKKPFWLPAKVTAKTFSGDKAAHYLRKLVPFFSWIERFIRPRGTVFQQHPGLQNINGGFLAIAGLCLVISLHPASYFLPGLSIALLSLGMLEEDILFVWLGYCALFAHIILRFWVR